MVFCEDMSAAVCGVCPNGTATERASYACETCASGYFALAGSKECTPCPAGKYGTGDGGVVEATACRLVCDMIFKRYWSRVDQGGQLPTPKPRNFTNLLPQQ